jgi:hypothetical protein
MSQVKVLITDDRGNGESVSSVSAQPVNTTINKKNGSVNSKEVKDKKEKSKAMAVATMIGSQAFSYMTSNVGKWTGSTKSQTQINNALELVSIGAMAYASMPIALAYVGINLAKTAIDTGYEQRWDAYSKEEARKRAGELKGRGR